MKEFKTLGFKKKIPFLINPQLFINYLLEIKCKQEFKTFEFKKKDPPFNKPSIIK